ncbi:MAG: 6-bladed beta-propeller [Nitrospirae bacterium]|nr:MAG: 6-bladed beta-propeller [Nitrospirota bacterium]
MQNKTLPRGDFRLGTLLRVTIMSVLALSLALTCISCGTPDIKPEKIDLFWPLPPDEPKIRYIEAFQSNFDIGDVSGSFTRELFGEERLVMLKKPYGVAVDRENRVYVTDIGRVFVFDKANRKLSTIGDAPGMGKLKVPIGIAISQAGKVYVSDSVSDRVFVYDKNGKYLSSIGAGKDFENPSGLAIDEKRQRIYIADSKLHNVQAFSLDGKRLLTIGKRGTGQGEFNFPTSIAVDSTGNLYVADTITARIQVFDPEGNYTRTIGELSDSPGNFVRPKGIGFDSEDHMYVVDTAFQNVQIFDKNGKLLLFFGAGGWSGPGLFMIPAGLTVDHEDRIYVVDQLNKRVQIFQYLGEKWKRKQAGQPAQ